MLSIGILLIELGFLFYLSSRLTIVISQLLFSVIRNNKITTYIFALLFLPGTFVHEMAHFLMAAVLLVPVGDVEFLPEMREGTIKLGSVVIASVDPFRRSLIGAAPFILGCALMLGLLHFFGQTALHTWWQMVLLGYAVFQIGNTMYSSKKDLEGSLIVVLFIAVIVLALSLLHVDVVGILEKGILYFKLIPVFQLCSFLLLVPIVIDIVCITCAHLILRYVVVRHG